MGVFGNVEGQSYGSVYAEMTDQSLCSIPTPGQQTAQAGSKHWDRAAKSLCVDAGKHRTGPSSTGGIWLVIAVV